MCQWEEGAPGSLRATPLSPEGLRISQVASQAEEMLRRITANSEVFSDNNTSLIIVQSVNSSLLIFLVCFISNVTFQLLLYPFFSPCHKIFAYLNVKFSKCWKQQALVCSWVILYSSICLVSAATRTEKWPKSSLPGRRRVGSKWGGSPSETEPVGTGALLVQAASERRFPQLIFIYLFILKERQITRGNKYWMTATECIFGTC